MGPVELMWKVRTIAALHTIKGVKNVCWLFFTEDHKKLSVVNFPELKSCGLFCLHCEWSRTDRKRSSKQLTRFVQMSFNMAPQGAKFLCHSVADLSVYPITECLHPRCEGKQLHRPGDQTGHLTNIIPAPCCSLNWPSIPNCLFTFILICVGLPTGFPISSFAPISSWVIFGAARCVGNHWTRWAPTLCISSEPAWMRKMPLTAHNVKSWGLRPPDSQSHILHVNPVKFTSS